MRARRALLQPPARRRRHGCGTAAAARHACKGAAGARRSGCFICAFPPPFADFSPRASQQAYCHVQCDAVRHSRPPLTAKQVNSDEPWFCCTDCAEARAPSALRCAPFRHSAPRPPLRAPLTARPGAQVAAALADETNAPRRPLDEHPQYTFELVRHDPALPAGRDAGCADYTASVVASALKIFATSFAPLILDDGRDMCVQWLQTPLRRL